MGDREELLPCPFCGGKAGRADGEFGTTIVCDNDVCSVSAYVSLGQAENAVSAWNGRHGCTQGAQMPDAGAVAAWLYEYNDIHDYWRGAVILNCPAKNPPTSHDGKPVRNVQPLYASPTDAGMRERAALDKVREIVSLYFAPWGAAKGARWESLTGDQPFNPEIAMSLIENALSIPSTDGKGGAS